MLQYISGAVISNGLRKNIEIVQSIEWLDRIGSDSVEGEGMRGKELQKLIVSIVLEDDAQLEEINGEIDKQALAAGGTNSVAFTKKMRFEGINLALCLFGLRDYSILF